MHVHVHVFRREKTVRGKRKERESMRERGLTAKAGSLVACSQEEEVMDGTRAS